MKAEDRFYGGRVAGDPPAMHGGSIGPLLDSVTGKLKKFDPNSDDTVLQRIKHVLNRGEALMEFYARTGLSRAQILTMSRDEISLFVEQVESSREDYRPPAIALTQPIAVPKKLFIKV